MGIMDWGGENFLDNALDKGNTYLLSTRSVICIQNIKKMTLYKPKGPLHVGHIDSFGLHVEHTI